jgi:hypothetical protein
MVQRRRYATRDELAELLAPYLEGLDEQHPDGDYKWVDVAREALDALGEMGAPVDALVKITVREDTN